MRKRSNSKKGGEERERGGHREQKEQERRRRKEAAAEEEKKEHKRITYWLFSPPIAINSSSPAPTPICNFSVTPLGPIYSENLRWIWSPHCTARNVEVCSESAESKPPNKHIIASPAKAVTSP